MLENPSENPSEPILKDHPQQISTQMNEAEEKRSKNLRCLLFLQAIWIMMLVTPGILPFPFIINSAPLFIAGFMINTTLNINKLKAQKITKYMLYYTLLRSFILIVLFVMCLLQVLNLIYVFHGKRALRLQLEEWTVLLGINAVIELISAYFTIQVLRFTNQYISLLNKKMSCEDNLKYNC